MSNFSINLESFGSKTQKLWPENRPMCNVWSKIGQVFLAITLKWNQNNQTSKLAYLVKL